MGNFFQADHEYHWRGEQGHPIVAGLAVILNENSFCRRVDHRRPELGLTYELKAIAVASGGRVRVVSNAAGRRT